MIVISALMLGSLGCSLGSLVTGMSRPTPTPTKHLVPTFTATATNSPTATPTDTPVATDTPPPTPTGTDTPTASPTPPFTTYVVQAGDTLSSIAVRFGTTSQAIMDANGMTSTIINIGTELLIPSSGSSVSPPPNPSPAQGGATPTSTPRPQPPPPSPTPTTAPPTATTQARQYFYLEGSMQEFSKGCSNLGVEGVIQDASGNPITGKVTVKWQLDGYVDYWVTGQTLEKPGVFKFNISPGPIYHGAKTSTLQVVESEANPAPLSDPHTWQILDCTVGPEFFGNIIFRRR